MDDQDDQPGPQGGAGAVRVGSTSGFAGITPQATAQVNEIKLQAELARLQQVNDVTERRAMTAENVANMFHQQRMSNPINSGLFAFGNQPIPRPPDPIPVASLNPDSVAAAVKSAMLGEKRSLQELMAHHGKSLKQTVQEAVSQSMSGAAAATPHPQREVASSSTDPVSVPGVPVGYVKEVRKKFEKGKKKTPPIAESGTEIPVPTEQQERKAKRAARPLQYGPEQERTRGVKRERDAVMDLEDIIYLERARDNPSAQLQKEATKARRDQRRQTLASRPLNFDGPDQFGARKRPASAQLESEKRDRPNPAVETQRMRDMAKEALEKIYKQQTGIERAARSKQLERVKREGVDIIRASRQRNPVRLDQFDLKREVDEIYDEVAQNRIGTTISEIVVPPKKKRSMPAGPSRSRAVL